MLASFMQAFAPVFSSYSIFHTQPFMPSSCSPPGSLLCFFEYLLPSAKLFIFSHTCLLLTFNIFDMYGLKKMIEKKWKKGKRGSGAIFLCVLGSCRLFIDPSNLFFL